jgi:hypothetical protein
MLTSIQNHGGKVVLLEKDADIILVDHLRKSQTHPPNAYIRPIRLHFLPSILLTSSAGYPIGMWSNLFVMESWKTLHLIGSVQQRRVRWAHPTFLRSAPGEATPYKTIRSFLTGCIPGNSQKARQHMATGYTRI